jgi:hypothetical protein
MDRWHLLNEHRSCKRAIGHGSTRKNTAYLLTQNAETGH